MDNSGLGAVVLSDDQARTWEVCMARIVKSDGFCAWSIACRAKLKTWS